MIPVSLDALAIEEGEEFLTLYTFNTGTAKHYFCSRCGIHPFHQTRSAPDKYAINAACLDGISPYDWPEMPVTDGRNHSSDNGGVHRYAGTMRFLATSD